MSRIAKKPISIPKGIEVSLAKNSIAIKGPKGSLNHSIHYKVSVEQKDKLLEFKAKSTDKEANALAGTTRALVANMVTGVSKGFERKLELVGVGFRALAKGKVLGLTLGFSHPVELAMPEGVSVQTPSQTEIIVSGSDKQAVGLVAAKIRAFRPPEPYKGKGVRYSNETIIRKETKKK
jgi:large subunit ribosomal protein L6